LGWHDALEIGTIGLTQETNGPHTSRRTARCANDTTQVGDTARTTLAFDLAYLALGAADDVADADGIHVLSFAQRRERTANGSSNSRTAMLHLALRRLHNRSTTTWRTIHGAEGAIVGR
jgi:hypothetical protein